MFTHENSMICREVVRFNGTIAPDEYMEMATGDDSFVHRAPRSVINGYDLPSVFEEDEDPALDKRRYVRGKKERVMEDNSLKEAA